MSAVLADIRRATLDDLMKYDGKAELIGGRIVPQMASGRRPNIVAGRIFRAFDDYAIQSGLGEAYTDNIGFAVEEMPSGRESFSPDASYYTGPHSADEEMDFIEGAPDFAVEVRSKGDDGTYAEREMELKRRDYFHAGTKLVWDVDPIENVILAYSQEQPNTPRRFAPGEIADAGDVLPGWRLDVADILR